MSTYIRLTDYKNSNEKEQEFFNPKNRYEAKQEDFEKIPGNPITYWVSDKFIDTFKKATNLGTIAKPRQGMSTNDNNRFLRFWYELDYDNIELISTDSESAIKSNKTWFPYNKGGNYRKWFGNNELVINWKDDGSEIKNWLVNNPRDPKTTHWSRRIINTDFYFKRGITWTFITTNNFGARSFPTGFLFDVGGSSIFPSNENYYYSLGLLNTNIVNKTLKVLNPTVNVQAGNISALPYIHPTEKNEQAISFLVQKNIDISKEDWDSREISWNFTQNELIKNKSDTKIETAYLNYCNYWQEQHNTLHQNEEELNRLFLDIYELQDELTPDIDLKDITILNNEAEIEDGELVFQIDEIMKQFISYGVGVMFGRYSLDRDGLLISNKDHELPTSATFEIDDDNVIPVLEDDFFTDDMASRFTQFVEATFGEESLVENINFIEKSLGTTIRKYFVKGFYEDHIKRYKKRPIYWMVSSPKKGFMSLIYMHRYSSDVFATIQNDYLREYIDKLERSTENLQRIVDDESNSNNDRSKATKEILKSNKIFDEIIQFDRDSLTRFAQDRIEIDLDDGVKVNYCKFKDVLYEFDKKLCQ